MENYVFHVKEKINKATFIQMFPNIQHTVCVAVKMTKKK